MRQYNFSINDNDYEVIIKEVTTEDLTAQVNGEDYVVKIKDIKDLAKASSVSPFKPVAPVAGIGGGSPSVASVAPASPKAEVDSVADAICSPMPGQIISIFVNSGDKVLAGQKVMVLEAMKMENTITADRKGVIQKIFVKEGDVVNQAQALLTIS